MKSLKTKKIGFILSAIIFISLLTNLTTAFAAYSGDLAIDKKDINFSSNNFLEGKTIRIYATASDLSNKDLLGIVRFYENNNQIGVDQAISIFANKNDGVFIDWTPLSQGYKEIAVKIFPWNPEIDDPSNNVITENILVLPDSDHDGTPDSQDTFPTDPSEQKDSDKDTIGDNKENKNGTNPQDSDTDHDNVPDNLDAFPLDPTEQKDSDGDTLGDNKEVKIGTNPLDADTDHDGVKDNLDAFPLDPAEQYDSDHDGLGDNAERSGGTSPTNPDTDKDGANDKKDSFPLNPKETQDSDHDSIGNNTEIKNGTNPSNADTDHDGIADNKDKFPLNQAPVIKLSSSDFTLDINDNKTFDASPSYDYDGKIVKYQWQIDDGPIEAGKAITTYFKKLGEHVIKLTVTDNSGESQTTQYKISVLNTEYFKQIGFVLLAILLALAIYFKYIAAQASKASFSDEQKEKDKKSM